MPTYAIGDIQGCYEALTRLLDAIAFDSARDTLWLVGDLVNRGPDSLSVLRWARALGDRCVMVLGNHEIHLIARALGAVDARRNETLDDVLGAPDRDTLIDWLRSKPLLHHDDTHALVHAAIHPAWDLAEARRLAEEGQAAILSAKAARWLRPLSKMPTRWDDTSTGRKRLQAILAGFTRLRCIDRRGRMADYAGPLDERPKRLTPWWAVPDREPIDRTVIFGHWAALGLHQAPGVLAIDTGCVWGRQMTAVRLEDGAIFSVPAQPPQPS
ncbi:MAG: symmetrical bis(5'-nucleosyl)-tetraphosphatase [Deltaproteobacteria bacterium]|nr:symmetrical bis(5'-nucleosyl)-tetraphosphatase [Deltaproteobacteria bacterium]